MRHDSAEYVKMCDRCQRYKPIPNLPAEVYHPQNNPWPFMQWAIDLVGPLPLAPAKKEMMIVATDYFTKWIEAEALSSTKEADVERFIWRNIIGKQITAFFAKYKIKQHLSTPRYPQGNGQAEASNKVILDCLKKRLEGIEGKWVDELPGVLWAYRTTKRRSTGETPFSLSYGIEAIIPPHVTVPSIGIEVGSIKQNSDQMRLNLDLLEGEREKAIVQVASYQQRLKSYYDKRAKIRQFQHGDLVLRKAFITAQRQGSKKIKPNWEGPYVISRSGGRGSYTLDTIDGKEIPRQWNAYHLRQYYPFSFQNVSSTHKTQLLSISSVLRETQGNDQKRPSGDVAHKKCPKGDTGCARNFLREVSSHIVAHKERPKGDAGRRLKVSVWGRSPLKKRPKGDAGCARNFLKGGFHASCGKYPGSYPFPKGDRIVIQLPISSVLKEKQGDD
ncbi:unnamed protein product [Prunus brigantina]